MRPRCFAASRALWLQRQVEHQHFGVVAVFQGQLRFVADLQCITGFQGDAIDLQLASGNLHIGTTAIAERVVQLLAAIEDGGEDAGILVDAQRTVGAVAFPASFPCLCSFTGISSTVAPGGGVNVKTDASGAPRVRLV